MRKRILSLFLCLVLLISSVPVQVFAAGEYLSDWEFTDGSLVLGDNTVAMVAGAEYTLIEFYPDQTGIYTFTGPSGSRLANFNASFFPNNITGEAAADTLEWTCSAEGQSLLLGICAQGESVTVSVARTGDYVSNEIQYTVYENSHTPNAANKDYCSKASGKLTPADKLVQKGDRYYTESGEAIFVNFAYNNLSISAMLGTSPARYVEKDASGNVVVAYDYYDALSAYAALGNYPLTTDLEQMLRHLDIAKRWTEDGWLNGWQELCFLVNDHAGGEAVVENGMSNTYCTSCGKLLKSEEAVVKVPHAFGTQALAEGSNTVILNSGAVYTLNKFKPAQTGVYTFEVPAGSKVANYNTSFNPMDLTGDAASTTLEWTCSSVGQHILVGVSGSGESVDVTITRTGDYVSNEIRYTPYENVHTPSKENADFCANVGGWFSVPSVVPQGDFYYGVTADGEYIPMFVDLAYSELSLTSMLETSSAKYAKLDENGNVVEAYNYYDALKAYTAFGKYPLTQDLMQMLQHLDEAKGWTANGWLSGWQELCFLASEHKAGEPVIEGNLAKYYCTGCNKLLKTEEAPEEECKHPDLKHVEAVPATCMAEGNIEHWYCEACETLWQDASLTQITNHKNVIVPVAEHDLVHVEAVAATCMDEGNIEHWYCKVCEVVWQDEALTQITNHKNVILPVLEHLDENKDGICDKCENKLADSCAHSNVTHTEAVAPSCMAEGKKEFWRCHDCQSIWLDEALTQSAGEKDLILPAAAHDLVHVEAVEATCMNEGNIEHWYCNVCEVVWQDEALTQITNHKNVIIPVADHDLVHVEAKEPTATEDGNIEHWYCSVCEVVWQDEALTQVTNHKNVIIPALGQPELPGNTAEEYILVEFTMNEDWTAGTATVTVEPGIWYYGAYISGMDLTANGEAVEVTPAQPRMPVIFCFTNEGTEAVTYELAVSYPVGTMSNPAALNLGENAAPIEEGNDQGYFFTWTAQVPGTLTVTMPQGNWFYTLSNLTAGIYGDMQYSNSDPVISAPQLEVSAGDQIQVIVNNFDPANPWTIPGGTLTFQASFEEAVLAPLALVPVADAPAEVVKQPDGSYIVYLDKEDGAEISPFSLLVQTLEPVSRKDLKWTVSDSRIASVKSEADSLSGIVTLKKGADGACVITAQNKKTKDEAVVTIVIRSYEPRLQSDTLTLNSNAHAGATVMLTESYGNAVSYVTVHEYDTKAKAYAEEVSQRLFPAYEEGILTVTHGEPMKKGTYKLLLKAYCENGEVYEYKVSLKVTETLPTVTVKQLNKFNTFYTDSEAQFLITSKDANVIGAELFFGENPAFQGSFDVETGILTVRYSESYLNGETKLKVKGDIMVFCEGYWIPVEKATTISTEKKAPKLALTSSSATLNTALNPDGFAWVGVYDPNTGDLLAGEDLWAQASFLEATADTDGLMLKLTGKKGGSVSIYAQQDTWTEALKFTFKLNVKTTKPSLKLTASTLKVNRLLPDYQEHTYYYLDQDNVVMVDCRIEPVSKKASVLAEAEKINVRFDGPVIVADLDPDNLPKKGTYEFKLTALVAGDVKLTKNFKVTVEEKLPTVKLKSATLKLNNQLGQTAYAETAVSATGLSYAYRLADLVPEKEYEQFRVCYDAETGILRTELLDGAAKAGKYKVKLYPKLESIQGSKVVLDKAVTVTVQIFSGKPSVTLKTTGKLDTIVPDSAVFYTITKLTNIAGSPDAVRLEGEGAELFNAELTDNGAKVTLNRDVQHRKDKTYKLKLVFTISGLEVSANVSLKVNQSTVKFASVKTVNYCQSQSSRMAVNLVMTAPAGASVGDIALGSKTAKQLIAALGEDAITWIPMADGTYLVSIRVANPGHLVYGKSYSLYLDVMPEGCAENAKPASVKITVKVAK